MIQNMLRFIIYLFIKNMRDFSCLSLNALIFGEGEVHVKQSLPWNIFASGIPVIQIFILFYCLTVSA